MFNQQENFLIDLLQQVKEVLDKHNIEFWLEGGTLLGALRNRKFIPWERDIDFGVWSDKVSGEMRMSIAKELRNRGFKVWIAENHMNISKEAGFWLDIDFYQSRDNYAVYPTLYSKNLIGRFLSVLLPILSSPYHPYYFNTLPIKRFTIKVLIIISRAIPSLLRKRATHIISVLYKKVGSIDVPRIAPSKYFRNLSTIKFYGMEFKVPAETEKYLTFKYGEDWRVAKKDWISERDDGMVTRFLSEPVIKK